MGDATVPATGRLRAPVFDTVLRPRRALVRSTALSVVCSAVPLVVALVWVTLPMRWWSLVAGFVVLLAVLAGVLFVRLGSAFLGIDEDDVVLHGVVTANRRIPRARVHHLVLVTTQHGTADRPVRTLLAFDADDEHLFRMRGDVWGDAALERVVDVLDVQVDREGRVLPAREVARRWPSSRAWYERRAGVAVAGGAAAALVVGVLAVETIGLLAR
ncbi:hypothetical protein GCM10009706_01680 [Curtobacterium citreum]|uniref:PH (Pleckstrin Homology) domain-containing protein n=1 Tax=Curtobacterium citreum TaxID=2036 RepID=A0ABT2HHK0_9MICO|nr:hypothetical protein [Curtobacterium citreum]MCS6522748.1 hypothetical protein [Curtobacterium citreum]TQJ28657.1 hypothetical protein FB462_2555 [Curtobacterium citreum]GGL66850.1 hypothetical protein GCM10009706_01680 [Curtobacterium citreum]